ncbi:MAG: 50S ribosomal protein L1 [Desulfurococcaceae archaeon]|jgi:large subunit ribosomal protein L1
MSLPSKDVLAGYIAKAIELGKGRRFKQSVELIIVLKDVDIKSQQLKIREVVHLPRGRGKEAKVCVVCDPDVAESAKEAGAHRVILSSELRELNKKQAKKIASECDWILVKPDLMGTVGKVLGPALGPRGKIPVPMPSGSAVKALITRYKNTVLVRIKDQPIIMTTIGSEDMNPEDLAENAVAVLSAIEGKLPARFANIGKLIFKATMGIPVEVSL